MANCDWICATMCHSQRSLIISVLALVGAFAGCNGDGSRTTLGGATSNGGGGGVVTSELGASCASSSGLSGTIVESQSQCYLDDAFCELRSDGHYCTGGQPFTCPEGQVRIGWGSCGFPAGGSSSAGATSNGGGGGQTSLPAGGVAGAATVSEPPSANGRQGGAGGDPASVNGGQGGTAGKCWELQPWSPDGCGTCQMTMAQYCVNVDCMPDPLPTCDGLADAYSIDEGCGLLQLRMSGHGGAIYTESIYDLATRELKYHFDNGGRSAGCMPALTVGAKPTCESWITRCEGLGGA